MRLFVAALLAVTSCGAEEDAVFGWKLRAHAGGEYDREEVFAIASSTAGAAALWLGDDAARTFVGSELLVQFDGEALPLDAAGLYYVGSNYIRVNTAAFTCLAYGALAHELVHHLESLIGNVVDGTHQQPPFWGMDSISVDAHRSSVAMVCPPAENALAALPTEPSCVLMR